MWVFLKSPIAASALAAGVAVGAIGTWYVLSPAAPPPAPAAPQMTAAGPGEQAAPNSAKGRSTVGAASATAPNGSTPTGDATAKADAAPTTAGPLRPEFASVRVERS